MSITDGGRPEAQHVHLKLRLTERGATRITPSALSSSTSGAHTDDSLSVSPRKSGACLPSSRRMSGSPSPVSSGVFERQVLAILDSTNCGETIELAFRRRECALRALFDCLSETDARTLHYRLSHPSPADQVVEAFGRMIVERQQRLLAFLADTPRRRAQQRSRP